MRGCRACLLVPVRVGSRLRWTPRRMRALLIWRVRSSLRKNALFPACLVLVLVLGRARVHLLSLCAHPIRPFRPLLKKRLAGREVEVRIQRPTILLSNSSCRIISRRQRRALLRLLLGPHPSRRRRPHHRPQEWALRCHLLLPLSLIVCLRLLPRQLLAPVVSRVRKASLRHNPPERRVVCLRLPNRRTPRPRRRSSLSQRHRPARHLIRTVIVCACGWMLATRVLAVVVGIITRGV